MKNLVTKLALAVATAMSSYAGVIQADMYGLEVGLGYRQDSILWEMKDHSLVSPCGESDLHFKDLEIVVLGAKFKGMLGSSIYTRASFDYGWIVDGSLREELSIEKHREASHFNNNGLFTEGRYTKAVVHNKESGNSFVWDFNVAFGMPCQIGCQGLQIAPMIGFSYDRQQIKIHNRERIYANFNHHYPHIRTGHDADKHATSSNKYRASWWGPWIGFDLSYMSDNAWTGFVEFELHAGRAERNRHSSLGIQYLDRYNRTKCFWGTSTRLGVNYVLCDCWYLEGAIGYSHWTSVSHRDSLYFSSGTARLDVGYLF